MARTGYYLVDKSPWPMGVAFSVFGSALSFITFCWDGLTWYVCVFGLVCVVSLAMSLTQWWMDMAFENCCLGKYTLYEVRNFYWGFLFFILSEWFFFFSFFWAFIHCSVGELSVHGVGDWPLKGITPLRWYGIPFINTIILLLSWPSSVWAHKALKVYNKMKDGEVSREFEKLWVPKFVLSVSPLAMSLKMKYSKSEVERQVQKAFCLTIFLGVLFTVFQAYEYYEAPFTIADGTFGSTFFLLTGFHGFHVVIGTVFLSVCLVRFWAGHFEYKHFTIAVKQCIWYWHFVDVIWLFVYGLVYVWGTW